MYLEASYELITTTRFDPFLSTLPWNDSPEGPSDFLLLRYHFDRLVHAVALHGWDSDKARSSLTYDRLKSVCHATLTGNDSQKDMSRALKIRIALSKTGVLTANVSPTVHFLSDPAAASLFNPISDIIPSEIGSILTIHIDIQPTPTSIFTSTKTTQRTVYNDARARIGLPPGPLAESDVLLYNPDNLITETSIFNVAFYRSSFWITPATTTGCLPGVFRRWLLEQGRIREADQHSLTKDSIKDGECVLLFNGAQGCRLGRIMCGNLKTTESMP